VVIFLWAIAMLSREREQYYDIILRENYRIPMQWV
jgi:hypothetical protein